MAFAVRNFFWRYKIIKEQLINDQIKASELRVISSDGEQLGIMSLSDANARAAQLDLDLVLISPQANPPVCKIMDYGKYRFEQIKKEKEAKKNQKIVALKEIQLSMTIDIHDMEVKARSAEKFLKNGDKIKVVIRMRGREMARQGAGKEVMLNFYKMVEELANIDKQPEAEGRNIIMMLSAKKK